MLVTSIPFETAQLLMPKPKVSFRVPCLGKGGDCALFDKPQGLSGLWVNYPNSMSFEEIWAGNRTWLESPGWILTSGKWKSSILQGRTPHWRLTEISTPGCWWLRWRFELCAFGRWLISAGQGSSRSFKKPHVLIAPFEDPNVNMFCICIFIIYNII